jgi:hypothetical protein
MLFGWNSRFVVIRNWMFVNMFFLMGLAIAVFYMERAFIPKARHIFFFLLLTITILGFITAFFPVSICVWQPVPEGIDCIQEGFDLFITNQPINSSLFTQLLGVLGYVSFAVIPLIYLILAIKTSGLMRRVAFLLFLGFLLILVNIHTVGHQASGYWYRSVPCLIGFGFVYWGNARFKRVMSATVDFYQTKHECIVHKGEIKGRVFMCLNCNAFYCIRCKNAIVKAENQCWNCKAVLKKSLKSKQVIHAAMKSDIDIEEIDDTDIKRKGEFKKR